MTETKRRIEKLERALAPQADPWEPVVFYDPTIPGDLEAKQGQAAQRAGNNKDGATRVVFLLPENGRPHPGRETTGIVDPD